MIDVKNAIKTKNKFYHEEKIDAIETGYAHLIKGNNSLEPGELGETVFALQKKLDAQTIPIQEDDPFYATDIIIFKNNYSGHLPLNGIKEFEYKMAKELYTAIINNETNIQIPCYLNEKEKAFIFSDICLLLTRKAGRELLEKVTSYEISVLVITDHNSKIGFDDFKNFAITLEIEMGLRYGQTTTPNRKKFAIPGATLFSLAHEFIHFTHFMENPQLANQPKVPPTLGEEFDNLEEQFTIVGIGEEGKYNQLNESRIRMAFGSPPRADHRGMVKRAPFEISESMPIAEIADRADNDDLLYIKRHLTSENVNNSVDIHGHSLLQYALLDGSPEMVQLILEKKPYSLQSKKSYKALVQIANKNKNPAVLLHLQQAKETYTIKNQLKTHLNNLKQSFYMREKYVFYVEGHRI